ncbi:MAG: hypothetical protein Q8T09_07215 [Candidatus Melainabacteria bacterium]|nr:hypothetical protein [Candidatus Melainabacteria bacterium]
MDDLFSSGTSLETVEIPTETITGKVETVEYLTVSALVKRLEIPRSTIYRHIQAGKYKTTIGPNGKLLVSVRQMENLGMSHETGREPKIETSETIFETVIPREASLETAAIPTETVHETSLVTVDIDELLRKLEGATYRIGYLEAQLESERQQVKLLTDSQHKPGWWAKFSSWFFKGQ